VRFDDASMRATTLPAFPIPAIEWLVRELGEPGGEGLT
jgi:hypothetical protein